MSVSTRSTTIRWYPGLLALAVLILLLMFEMRREREVIEQVPVPDFAAITDIDARKEAFFNYLLPVIEEINAQRAQERERLLAIRADIERGRSPNYSDRRRLRLWAERYGIEDETRDAADLVEPLLLRLDQIPSSMVLAQAAMESAWGTSRFAVDGNNYFGQWCYRPGCGLIPSRRAAGAGHEVRIFDTLEESILAYFRNINTHAAYREVRELRAAFRSAGLPLSGLTLVEGLERYSERGEDYVEELQQVIEHNDLE